MRKDTASLTVLAAICLSGCAKIVVTKIDKPSVPAEGVIYALPNTVLRVQLKVDRVDNKPAPFALFAGLFAPDGKRVCQKPECAEDKTVFSIKPGATFATYGEPDPKNVFLVNFAKGRTLDQSVSMTWNEAGLLSAASASVTNRTTDIVMSGIKLAAGLGAKAAGLGSSKAEGVPAKCSAVDPIAEDSDVDGVFLGVLAKHGPLVMSAYCGMDKADRLNLPRDEKALALLDRAAVAYLTRVAPLLVLRDQILKGTKTDVTDAGAILPRIEAEIASRQAALYLGASKTTTWDGSLDLRALPVKPGKGENVDKKPISLLLLAADGVCFPAGVEIPPSGSPLPEGFASPTGCAKSTPVKLYWSYYPAVGSQLFGRMDDIEHGERGFRYRIPAQVKGVLAEGDDDKTTKEYGAGVFAIAQLGTVISLPAKRTSKMLSYDLTFAEATGALKSFKLGTTGSLDAATVDALAAAGGTALDARNKAELKADELTAVTRLNSLTKLKDEICTIQKKYNLPCTVEPQ